MPISTEVVMPQMGESVAEGTIVRWLKRIGDAVERDEPLFEISTDKVDAEIPSPIAGVLTEVRVNEGETVAIDTVVAVIEQIDPPHAGAKREHTEGSKPASDDTTASTRSANASATPPVVKPIRSDRLQRTSPLVRRIAKDHKVDLSRVQGTGIGGRVTKQDIQAFIASVRSQEERIAAATSTASEIADLSRTVSLPKMNTDRVEKMSVMRKKIAKHMIVSRRTSAHVHSVFEVNFSRIAQIRDAKKAEFARAGTRLTYLSFIIKAVTNALKAVPIINASIDGENVVYHSDINIGVAVAVDWGLIVPVIKRAAGKNLLGLSRAVSDLAARARAKQLKSDEVAGGTFTITNTGGIGAQFGMPIINQPQVAILGVGAIQQRPVVVDNAIGIRTMGYLTLGFDHRIIDGFVADEFLGHVKQTLEKWNISDE